MLTAGITLSAVKTERAGVIPYTIINNKVFFLLAKHKFSGDLGDFGGGVKKEETSLKGAIREYYEESGSIFINEKADYDHSLALLDNKMAILFLYIQKEWYGKAEKVFAKQKKAETMYPSCRQGTDEISDILWVSESQFVNLVKYPKSRRYQSDNLKLWKLIVNFFKKIDIKNLMEKIKNVQ